MIFLQDVHSSSILLNTSLVCPLQIFLCAIFGACHTDGPVIGFGELVLFQNAIFFIVY